MKRLGLVGVLCFGLLLGACSNQGGSSAKEKELQATVDSLKTENSVLKEKVKGSEGSTVAEDSSATTETSESVQQISDKFPLNETVELFNNGNKKVAEIKIVEATTSQSVFPDHMISLDDFDTTKMVAVKIEYTNVAMDENFLPYADYFQAFSDDGKALTQVSQQNGQDAVSIGRTGTTQLFWELPVDGSQFSHMEIDFVPSTTKVATFSIDVSH